MILNLNEVTTLIAKLKRKALGWLIAMQNKSRKEVTVNRRYQENPAGGMFGLLVSSDDTRRQ